MRARQAVSHFNIGLVASKRPHGPLRDAASLQGLRFQDLRHTAITAVAEMGVADHALESISGHLSRRMLEHHSYIRIDATRQALDALDMQRGRVLPEAGNCGEAAGSDTEIEAITEAPESVTSQSVTV